MQFFRRSKTGDFVFFTTPGALVVPAPDLEEFDVPEDEIDRWTDQLRIPPHPGAKAPAAAAAGAPPARA